MSDVISALIEGLGHQRAGRAGQAETIYRDVLARDPAQPNALYLYGLLQLRDGRVGSAADLLQAASGLRDDTDVHLHLVRARLAANDPAAALAAVDHAIALDAPPAEALYLRGTALNALARYTEAAEVLAEAARHAPIHAGIRLNLGNAHADLDQLDEAERHIRAAIRLDPALVEAQASLGYVLTAQGRLAAAIAACEAALALDPLSAEAHWNLATALLLAGNYERGFREYEWHSRHRLFQAYWRNLPGQVWTGGSLAGKTLLVHAGQGLGDTIQLARYMPLLANRGARVMLACSASLLPFLSGQPGIFAAVSRAAPLPPYDLWIDQMSLPRLLDTRADTIPGHQAYLTAEPERRRRWADRLRGRTIGFAWAGNPAHANDRRRSLPPELARMLAGPDMVGLQVGPRAEDCDGTPLLDVSSALTDYAETAALIAQLDLVITVDTSVAHLAGALGVATWLLLPAAPDWRWILGRDDTPWYGSLRLFRQQTAGDWHPVIEHVRRGLGRPAPSLGCD